MWQESEIKLSYPAVLQGGNYGPTCTDFVYSKVAPPTPDKAPSCLSWLTHHPITSNSRVRNPVERSQLLFGFHGEGFNLFPLPPTRCPSCFPHHLSEGRDGSIAPRLLLGSPSGTSSGLPADADTPPTLLTTSERSAGLVCRLSSLYVSPINVFSRSWEFSIHSSAWIIKIKFSYLSYLSETKSISYSPELKYPAC